MTIKERVTSYLRTRTGLDFCPECLARPLELRNITVYQLALELEGSPEFSRGYRPCSICGKRRLVIRGLVRTAAA